MILTVLFLLASVIFVPTNEAARILAFFPVPSISHQVVFRPLTQELARRGHKVIVVTPDPVFKDTPAPSNLTEIDVHDISYDIWIENFMNAAEKGTKASLLSQMKIIYESFGMIFEAQIQTEEVKNIINDTSQKFDLLLLEACVRPALSLSYVFKDTPVILVSSFGSDPKNYDLIGAAYHPLLYPSVLRQRIYNLTFWEKITQLYDHYQLMKLYNACDATDHERLKKYFGPDIPSISDLGDNVDMLLLNVNQIFEGIRPVPPNVVYMGGLHQKPLKELPTDLKSYLDASKNGVIYFSLGTNVAPSSLPPERIQTLINVFSKLPYDVLWKWDQNELLRKSDNIKIAKWLPQSDLLRHPKIKLFITQGGLQSTDEAITAGVPLIGLPMLADQWYNVEKYVYFKIGLQLDLETLTEEQFREAIITVINDDSYRRNIENLRRIMQDTPIPPLERAIWNIEYVLRHKGAKHLRSPAANMTMWTYLELDLVFNVLSILLTAIGILFLVIYLLFTKIVKRSIEKDKTS